MNSPKFLLHILLLCFFFHFSVSIDTITLNSPLRDDGTVIVSVGKVFALGFFSPGGGNSKNRYVGIWYNQVPEQTVVWVANRDNPIDDKSGILSINNQGNLVLFGKNRTDSPVWSTNVSVITAASENSAAQLLDSGNLVLFQDDTKRSQLWQSFDYPSNTFLPLMKLGLDRRIGLNRFVTSWISPDDPGTGNYSFKMDTTGFPQLILYKGSDILWQAGSWTGQRFTGVPEMSRNYVLSVTYVDNEDEVYFMNGVTVANTITRMVVNESGILQRFTWNAENGRWIRFWSDPNEQCDFYNYCGPNSNCNPYPVSKFECDCLPGYEPMSPNEWFLRDGSGGCVEKRVGSMCRSGEGFVKVARVKVPDTSIARANMSLGLKQCEEMCLNNCSCMAYANAHDGGIGCLMWHGDLMDTRTYANDGQDLYVRVDAVELALYAKKKSTILDNKGILAILIVSGVVGLSMAVCIIYCLVRRKSKGVRLKRSSYSFRYKTSRLLQNAILNSNNVMDENKSTSEVSFFDFSTIVTATNNFSRENKLGEGGFGPVYKGVLLNGEEIAVKRLSKHSGQGVREFKNEITLIAKLQHRNLVRMLGCCIEEEEKMLIYEYLPNKSLDFFIFDKMRGSLLDWETRFEIICGIARGILYLHQDSRLRIIHRDLKASNVLLDVAMNPKISDFGMARIFGSDQVEGNTNRVVGTYGYMSPEYAMQGQFSTKSDVYSFGIILLEIVSGRKNSGHYPDTIDTILVGRIWNLWREGKAMEIVDSSLIECGTFSVDEVLKCIHIGLLCVQDCVTDRPAMSAVVFMLGNAGALIPLPNRPVFVLINNGDDHNDRTGSSVNLVTVTAVQGR